jgi:hypothetical protein
MGRRRRARRDARLRGAAWLLGGLGLLVGGLLVGEHLLEESGLGEPAPSLEREAPPDPPAVWDRVRVEVLNAGGVRGMAGEARDHLRDEGFDVVFYGNAATFDREETLVLARTGSVGAARAVAERLGAELVASEPDSARFVDVTVLLGSSWVRPDALGGSPAGEGDPATEGPWWDPRGYLGELFGGTTMRNRER